MEDGLWYSVILGLGTGGIHVLLVYLSLRMAKGRGPGSFVMIVFGGMAIRLFVAVAIIALVFALAEVSKVVYIATFFCIFLIGLISEVFVLHRYQASMKNDSHSDA